MKNQERNICLCLLMRVLFCKIHCPSFFRFCKPSTCLLYKPTGPLKLENRPHVPSSTAAAAATTATAADKSFGNTTDSITINGVKEESVDVVVNGKQSQGLKSCLKKSSSSCVLDSKQPANKKTVQWLDFLGKELVQIREFESSESDDTDGEDQKNRGCTCIIL